MSIVTTMFYFFSAITAISAVSMIFVRNVFYGALLLIVCLLSLAGIYVLAFAEFLAVTQILIYAGGILVVIIFGIMLTSKLSGKPLMVSHGNWFGGLLVSGLLLVVLIYFLGRHNFSEAATEVAANGYSQLNLIGIGFMSDFVLPFEVAGILLLVSLIGASVLASTVKSKKE